MGLRLSSFAGKLIGDQSFAFLPTAGLSVSFVLVCRISGVPFVPRVGLLMFHKTAGDAAFSRSRLKHGFQQYLVRDSRSFIFRIDLRDLQGSQKIRRNVPRKIRRLNFVKLFEVGGGCR